jgi:hypothetical protein
MSILTPTEVAAFLGVDASTEGLREAIAQAESLVAGKLGLSTLEFATYTDETRIMGYTSQQVIPRHGPVREVTAFSYDGDDVTSDVEPTYSGWSIVWSEPYAVGFDRVKSFDRMKRVVYTYSAGWTNSLGDYPLPTQVAEYAKSLTGIVLGNLLASGVYDTKLGDMTIKIQRETLEKNLMVYDNALRMHARP